MSAWNLLWICPLCACSGVLLACCLIVAGRINRDE